MPPTTQMPRTRLGEPSWPARKPVPVKITVPIMLETTSAVALNKPNWRRSPAFPAVTTSFYELSAVPGYAPWHFLYFLPLPQGQGSLRPTLPDGAGAAAVACSAASVSYTHL